MIDAKKILNKLHGEEPPRGAVTVYLNKGLYKDFKSTCKEVSASKVMEELMRQFIDSANSKTKNIDTNAEQLLSQIDDPEIIDTIKGILEAHLSLKKPRSKKKA